MHDVPAIAVQNAAHVVKSAAQVQIAYVDMPMFVRTARLLETLSFARWLEVVTVEDTCRFQHATGTDRRLVARCADRHDVGIKHLVRESSITIERMLPIKIEDRSFLPVLEPMIARPRLLGKWQPLCSFTLP